MEQTSETLAAVIVAHRAFGLFEEKARDCMVELLERRENGDTFDFERFIDQQLNDLPQETSALDNDIFKILNTVGLIGSFK
jgi:hypothetical protein